MAAEQLNSTPVITWDRSFVHNIRLIILRSVSFNINRKILIILILIRYLFYIRVVWPISRQHNPYVSAFYFLRWHLFCTDSNVPLVRVRFAPMPGGSSNHFLFVVLLISLL